MIILLALLALQDPGYDLGELNVRAKRLDTLLSVVVNEDAPEHAVISSAPIGIRCGSARFEYSTYEAPRLCWIRRLPGSTIQLTAKAPRDWDQSWRVEWSGCDTSDGRNCSVALGQEDVQVAARFIRPTG